MDPAEPACTPIQIFVDLSKHENIFIRSTYGSPAPCFLKQPPGFILSLNVADILVHGNLWHDTVVLCGVVRDVVG